MRKLEEIEQVFPTYDSAGNRVSSHRFLQSTCTAVFDPDNACVGSCDGCTSMLKPKCKASEMKCKNSQSSGVSFPFLGDPASLIGVVNGKDIQLIDFTPPPL